MSAPITGKDGKIEISGTPVADVFSWSITEEADLKPYASSSTAGWRKVLVGQKGWTISMVVALPDGSFTLPFASGDSIAFAGFSMAGKYVSGTVKVGTIEPEVSIEDGEPVRATVNGTGDGELSKTG